MEPTGTPGPNDALRFALELFALGAFAYWGWTTHVGVARYAWAVGLPLLVAVTWGTFRVPNDPGPAPVAVPGPVRLALELLAFGAAAWLLAAAGRSLVAAGFAVVTAIHYFVARDRVGRLLTGA